MRRAAVITAVALAAATTLVACGGGSGDSGSAETRQVLVDYKHDEFATSMFAYFPASVAVHPGDTVRFRQNWTGEPHSVTFVGPELNDGLAKVVEFVKKGPPYPEEPPPDLLEDVELLDSLPYALGGADFSTYEANQNVARPCYLRASRPPTEPSKPCPSREQPLFDGKWSYYSSGLIPYQGNNGNTFEMQLAPNIEPGTYAYYCNVHGILQSGEIVVQPAAEAIPSQEDVNRQARREIEDFYAEPMEKALAAVNESGVNEAFGMSLEAPVAGVLVDGPHGLINEFVPNTIETSVNEPVTWTMAGGHTISFNVPKYFPLMTVANSGQVTINERAWKPVGWPDRPESPAPASPDEPPEPVDVDLGRWNGKGFKSTGLLYSTGDTITLRFSRPGTYVYACLIHPPMIGKVIVD